MVIAERGLFSSGCFPVFSTCLAIEHSLILKLGTNRVFQVLLQQQEREFTFAEEARAPARGWLPCSHPIHRSHPPRPHAQVRIRRLREVTQLACSGRKALSIWVGARDSKRTQVLSRAGLASKQMSPYKGQASVGPGTQLSVQWERKACHDESY